MKKLTLLLVTLIAVGAVPAQNPVIVTVTQIRGAEGTASCGGGYDLGVNLADLDHGLAAGATTYDHGGFILCDTYAPYLWSEQDARSTLFELEGEYNWEESAYVPTGITPGGNAVVGGAMFFERYTYMPWMWTNDGDPVEFLNLIEGYTGGNAVAISNDGRLVAGNLCVGRVGVNQAVVWSDGSPQILPSRYPWSRVGSNPFDQHVAYSARRTHPMKDDGSIIVGAAGADFLEGCKATEWVNRIEQQLSTGGVAVQSSVAVFVSESGVIFGYAVLDDGHVVLMRWDSNGNPEMFQPPDGLSVVNLSSIDSEGNAAGGALAEKFECVECADPACARKPFVWTIQDGFTILPQNALEKIYNRSTVQDVSDNGRVAVGQLSACVVTPNSPPLVAFIWTAESGMVFVNDLMAAFGWPDPHYYSANDVSRDGNRVLVVGNPPLIDSQSTADLILDLTWPTPPRPSPTPRARPTPRAHPTPAPRP